MPDSTSADHDVTRRSVLRGVALGGVAGPLLAACAGGGGGGTPGDGGGTGGPSGTTVSASDVPVGGGTIVEDALVVVTQPTEGDFKAFSAVCTHQGCPVQDISDGRITCNCHGSQFSIEDGSVLRGPATRPLESLDVQREGDQVTVSGS